MVKNFHPQYSQYRQQPYGQYSQQQYGQFPNNQQQFQGVPSMGEIVPQQNNDKAKKAAFVIGSWFGLNKMMDVFNNACTNENYDKTIIGRLGNWGDRIANKYGETPFVKAVANKLDALKGKTKSVIDGSPILSAIFKTPTSPECPMVTGFLQTQQHADIEEAARTLNGYLDELPKSLKEAGASKAEIAAFKAKYNTGIFGGVKNEVRAIQEFQFDKLGKPKGFIDTLRPEQVSAELRSAKLRHLGLTEEMLKAPNKFEAQITEACRRGGKNLKAFFGRTGMLKILSPITKRETNASMSYNKLIANSKHTTKLGKFLSKLPKLLVRGLTFGGGKINSLLVAFGLGTALFNTTKAPKEQKVGTAVAGGVDAVSWILSMPLAIKIMHGVNGLKNIGRSKAEVDAHLSALKAFNADVAAGNLTNKTAYCRRLIQLKNLEKPAGKLTGMQKVLSKIGRGLSVALELPSSYKEAVSGPMAKPGAMARNLKRAIPNFAKNCLGYPLRFAIYMMLVQPLVDKVISKVTSSIFGKPYEPDEEKEAKEQIAQSQVQNNPNINPTMNPYQSFKSSPSFMQDIDYSRLPEENLIRQYFDRKFYNQATYVPKEVCGIKSTASPYDNEYRTYIPSEVPVAQSFKSNDRERVDAALLKADVAQKNAMEFLNGIK